MGAIVDASQAAQRQVLAAGAQAGDAGVAEFRNAQAQLAASRQEALSQAAGDARLIGAPNVIGSLGSLVTRPSDQISNALTAQQAGFSANIGAQTNSHMAALSQLAASEPFVNQLVAAAQAKAAGGGGGGGSTKAPAALSDAKLRVDLLGAAQVARKGAADPASAAANKAVAQRTALDQQQQALEAQIRAKLGKQAGAILAVSPKKLPKDNAAWVAAQQSGKNAQAVADVRNLLKQRTAIFNQAQALREPIYQGAGSAAMAQLRPISSYAQDVGPAAGLAPADVAGLVGPTQDKTYAGKVDTAPFNYLAEHRSPNNIARQTGLKLDEVTKIRASAPYLKGAQAIQAALASGMSHEDFTANVTADAKKHPRIAKILAFEYEPYFLSQADRTAATAAG